MDDVYCASDMVYDGDAIAARLVQRLAFLGARLSRPTDLPSDRWNALLISCRLYEQMVRDALAEIAAVLPSAAVPSASHVVSLLASGATDEASAPRRTPDVAAVLDAVFVDLDELHRQLQPWAGALDAPAPGALTTLWDDWNVAVNGLRGPTGVLLALSRALPS
ncbi:hypothetical protein [Micromonospora chokoriensis]